MYRRYRITPQERQMVRNAVTLLVSVTALMLMTLNLVLVCILPSHWLARMEATEAGFLIGLLVTLLAMLFERAKVSGIAATFITLFLFGAFGLLYSLPFGDAGWLIRLLLYIVGAVGGFISMTMILKSPQKGGITAYRRLNP